MGDFELFKKEIYKLIGIDLNYYKEKQMKRRIDSLIRSNKFDDYALYFKAIKENKELLDQFVNHLTINVSEFYRNPEQWEHFQNLVIPILIEKKSDIKIWSAACSTGDEPYTIAMVLSEYLPLSKVKIFATDIDDEVLRKAKAGQYTPKSISNLPEKFKTKFFINKQDRFEVTDELKKCINFSKHNLLEDKYFDKIDLIVCRNVLIYFTEEAKVKIYKKFSDSLVEKGILFVGSTEQIVSANNYKLKPLKTFFYTKDSTIV